MPKKRIFNINSFFRKLILNEKLIINSIPDKKGKILDLGCGNGYFTYLIAKNYPNSEVIGIDNDEKKIQNASKIHNLKNLKFSVKNILKLEMGEEFDVIIGIDVMHHIRLKKHQIVMEKIKKHLKVGGVFINVDLDGDSKIIILNTIHDILLNKTKPNYKSSAEWKSILENFGFKAMKIIKSTRLIYPHLYIISKKI